jgi:uncharacterized protein (TIGR02145 family)
MLKNEYLSEKDIMGTDYHQNANGEIQEGTQVNIRCIEVGGQKIYNVKASITNTVDAPLLFGQSAMQRFGKFSIDYATNSLILGGVRTTETAIAPAPPKAGQTYKKVCKDIDGNTYKTVKIGTQIWMAENLKTSRYKDGSAIKKIEDKTQWEFADKSQTAAWCYYDNNSGNNPTYGKLYNYYVVTDPRSLCPIGWHVPKDWEFTILTDYLGGNEVVGGKMKAITLWNAPNKGADNSSGYTAFPAGTRYSDGAFDDLGVNGNFWSSTEINSRTAWCFILSFKYSAGGRVVNYKEAGLSVRCIED